MTFKTARNTLGTEEYAKTLRKVWDAMPPTDKAHLNIVMARYAKSLGLHSMSLTDKLDLLAQIGAVLQ